MSGSFGSGFAQGMRALDDMFATISANKLRDEQTAILTNERQTREGIGSAYRQAIGEAPGTPPAAAAPTPEVAAPAAGESTPPAAGAAPTPAASRTGAVNPFGEAAAPAAAGAGQSGGGFGGAIQGFYDWIRGGSGDREAVPGAQTEARRSQKLADMRSVNVSEVEQGVRRVAGVQPGQPTPGLAWDKMNDLLTDQFMRRGDVQGLRQAQAYMEVARSKGLTLTLNSAIATAQAGDMQGAAVALNRANSFMPDGRHYTATPGPNGVELTVTDEKTGAVNKVALGAAEIQQYANNLLDPEKQRAYIMDQRKQAEVERNGASTRGLQGISGRVALASNARANEDQGWQREDRATAQQWSAATTNLAALQRDPNATPEAIAAARAAVDTAQGRMTLAQRGGAVQVATGETALSNSVEDRAAGKNYVAAVTEAQTLAQKLVTMPAEDPRRPAAEATVDAAVAKAAEAFGGLNLSQASTAQQLETRMDTLNVNRQDRATIGTFLTASSAVVQAEAEVAAAGADPAKRAAALQTLGAAKAAARNSLAGMSPSAATKLAALDQGGLLGRAGLGGSGSRGPKTALTPTDRDKVVEELEPALRALPEASRAKMGDPNTQQVAMDLAVDLASNNTVASRQAAIYAYRILDGSVPMSESGVVRLPGGQTLVLEPEVAQAVLKRMADMKAADNQPSGLGQAVGGLGTAIGGSRPVATLGAIAGGVGSAIGGLIPQGVRNFTRDASDAYSRPNRVPPRIAAERNTQRRSAIDTGR